MGVYESRELQCTMVDMSCLGHVLIESTESNLQSCLESSLSMVSCLSISEFLCLPLSSYL